MTSRYDTLTGHLRFAKHFSHFTCVLIPFVRSLQHCIFLAFPLMEFSHLPMSDFCFVRVNRVSDATLSESYVISKQVQLFHSILAVVLLPQPQ
jgi:hypothetical protein